MLWIRDLRKPEVGVFGPERYLLTSTLKSLTFAEIISITSFLKIRIFFLNGLAYKVWIIWRTDISWLLKISALLSYSFFDTMW